MPRIRIRACREFLTRRFELVPRSVGLRAHRLDDADECTWGSFVSRSVQFCPITGSLLCFTDTLPGYTWTRKKCTPMVERLQGYLLKMWNYVGCYIDWFLESYPRRKFILYLLVKGFIG